MSESKTPRTDAIWFSVVGRDTRSLPASFFKRAYEESLALEIALTAAQAELRETRERAGLLFSLLLGWQSAFHNRGETTSIHDWNERMKKCDEETSKALAAQRSEGAGN